jgi:hypothetical protein
MMIECSDTMSCQLLIWIEYTESDLRRAQLAQSYPFWRQIKGSKWGVSISVVDLPNLTVWRRGPFYSELGIGPLATQQLLLQLR